MMTASSLDALILNLEAMALLWNWNGQLTRFWAMQGMGQMLCSKYSGNLVVSSGYLMTRFPT